MRWNYCGWLLSALMHISLAGRAQKPVGNVAAVRALSAAGQAVVRSAGTRRFAIPQVQLADGQVAARINRELVAQFSASLESPARGATARQAAQQAEAEYKSMNNQGVTNAGYEVLYNSHHLLSLALNTEYLGAYPSTATSHATFDLRTGRLVRVEELVRDTAALRRRWQQAISRAVAARLRTLATDYPELDADGAGDIQERLGWDAKLGKVRFEPGSPDFTDFALTPTGLVLYHDFGFPHVILALEPEEACSFSYASLRAWLNPQGPLGFRK